MKKVLAILILCALFLPLSASDVHPLTQWKFHFGEANKAEQLDFDDSQWENVSVPHDWAITKPFDMRIDMQTVRVTEGGDKKPFLRTGRTGALPCFGIGWYRTHLAPIHTTTGQRIYVQFDGAMSLSKVYLNGHYVGGWPYGYTSFQVDVTDAWNPQGNNVLAVRLNNKEKSSRWYSGAGLYRNVRLVIKEPVSIAHWGLRIATPHISTKRATAVIQTTLENTQTQQPQHVTLETILCDSEGKEVTHHTAKTTLHGQKTLSQNLKVAHPALWSPSHPALYAIVSKVYVDHQLMDSSHTTFGFRSIVFDPLKGMLINGVPTEIKGVCRHHDLGPLGAAVNVQAIERQILLLKEMGCNAIRTSHNPASPELLSVCDRLGMTVMEEAFDEWEMGKNDNGYYNYFKQWAKKDVEAMVNRDKNHPCIIMWSTGNEIREQGTQLGVHNSQMLVDIFHQADPTRPVSGGSNDGGIKSGMIDTYDLIGVNYLSEEYDKLHERYPNKIIFGSETASTVSSRGCYYFPTNEGAGINLKTYQVSSYDLDHTPNGDYPDKEFLAQENKPWLIGEYIWTGLDYLGEPSPFNRGTPARSSYFGCIDLAGLKKDRFYLYQSHWSKTPVLHLLPHWNWEGTEGKTIPVYCYTNYPKVELFVNGKSQGIQTHSTDNAWSRYRLMWNKVIYQPGELKAVAYDQEGNKVDETVIRTAGEEYSIKLTPSQTTLQAGHKNLSFVTVEVTDSKGVLCPKAQDLLFFDTTGAVKVKAACNGDATSQTAFSSTYMRVFNGKMVLIVEGTDSTSSGTLTVYGNKLKTAKVNFTNCP